METTVIYFIVLYYYIHTYLFSVLFYSNKRYTLSLLKLLTPIYIYRYAVKVFMLFVFDTFSGGKGSHEEVHRLGSLGPQLQSRRWR